MKRALRTATALFVVSTLFAACAGSEEAVPNAGEAVDAGPAETGKITAQPSDSGPAPDTAPTKVCIQGCTNDSECQSSCPAAPNGIYCCDVKSGICYAPAESTCPSPSTEDDSGTPSY